MKTFADMTPGELAGYLQGLAASLEAVMPPGPGPRGKLLFALLLFDQDNIGRYVSNANRQDVISSMREFADALEAGEVFHP